MMIWLIGWCFCIGLNTGKTDRVSGKEVAKMLICWPMMLGEELRELLKKDSDDEQN